MRTKGILLKTLYSHAISYPTPSNLNYFWNFGFLAGILLIQQILTGIFLSMHYLPEVSLAFFSVEHIMRDVLKGWLLRYLHANGASMFFLIVYIHMFRGLFFGSFLFPREKLWNIGVLILLIMILTGFLGYVLPWGQMSFWAATVITNLATAVPFIGKEIVFWLWGGFSVSGATLIRFYSLHFLLPFILVFLSFLHLIFLHENGSNNPLGLNSKVDQVVFTPYFTIKDFFSLFIFFIVFYIFVFFYPNFLGHPDNYIYANPLVTPTHIVPEWYFLPFYAILRSIPHKLLGVVLLVLSIAVFFLLPLMYRTYVNFTGFIVLSTRSAEFKPLWNFAFWCFLYTSLILLYIGSQPVEYPYASLGLIVSFYYFFFLLIIVPFCWYYESIIYTIQWLFFDSSSKKKNKYLKIIFSVVKQLKKEYKEAYLIENQIYLHGLSLVKNELTIVYRYIAKIVINSPFFQYAEFSLLAGRLMDEYAEDAIREQFSNITIQKILNILYKILK